MAEDAGIYNGGKESFWQQGTMVKATIVSGIEESKTAVGSVGQWLRSRRRGNNDLVVEGDSRD